jgi:hypothetical protein
VKSLSLFSEASVPVLSVQSTPDTTAQTIGPVTVFERIWKELEIPSILYDLVS